MLRLLFLFKLSKWKGFLTLVFQGNDALLRNDGGSSAAEQTFTSKREKVARTGGCTRRGGHTLRSLAF